MMVAAAGLWPLLLLWLGAAGCGSLPASPGPAAGLAAPKRIERQRFPRPKRSFEEAVRIVSEEWYDPDLGSDAIYAHAWSGLVVELSFEDAATAAAVDRESDRTLAGRARFASGVRAVRRAWRATGIDDQTIYHHALKGLVRDLSWDGEMLQAWAPEHAAAAKDKLAGETVSIGLETKIIRNQLIVVDVVPDSPADRAGLEPGDRVYAIDGDFLDNKGLRDIDEMIRKPAGTKVTLLVGRGGATYRLPLTCEKFKARDARGEVLRGVGVLRILNFSATAPEDFGKQLDRFEAERVRGIVLDLRQSGGGLARASVVVACRFLSTGTAVLFMSGRDGEPRRVACEAGGDTRIPLVVLTDGETTSAGEMLVAALRDNGRAKVIGEKTHGYGVIKGDKVLPNGYTFRIITDLVLSPNRRNLLAYRIPPDREIALAADEVRSARLERDVERRLARDTQLSAAIELLPR